MSPSTTPQCSTARSRRQRLRGLLGAVALAGLLLGGCSAADDQGESESAAAQDERAAAQDKRAGAQDSVAQGSGGGDAGTVAGTPVSVQPRQIHRGQVSVQVDDLSRSSQQVYDIAAGLGGYVSDESLGISQTAYDEYDEGSQGEQYRPPLVAQPGEARMVLRVPPEHTTEAMNQIAALGTETGRWRSATNVELTLVDLESRVATQTKAVEQAQALMERAQSLPDIVMLENEVNTRTAELESLQARRASLSQQAEMATVTAVLLTVQRTEEIDDAAGFLGGLRSGWDALTASVAVLLTVVGTLLPFAVVGVVIGYPLYRLVRGRRARRAGPAQA